MGFNAEIRRKKYSKIGDVLRKVEPDDLIRFGLIPEIVGRLPMVLGLDELDEDALLKSDRTENALTDNIRNSFPWRNTAYFYP